MVGVGSDSVSGNGEEVRVRVKEMVVLEVKV